jgi:hypothetical protein
MSTTGLAGAGVNAHDITAKDAHDGSHFHSHDVPAPAPAHHQSSRVCEWANCRRNAVGKADEWHFCKRHHSEHDQLRITPGGIRGHLLPLTKDIDSRPNALLTRHELLTAVLAENTRPVPPRPGSTPVRQRPSRAGIRQNRRQVA